MLGSRGHRPPTEVPPERGSVRLEVLQQLHPRGDAAAPPAELRAHGHEGRLAVADHDGSHGVLRHHAAAGQGGEIIISTSCLIQILFLQSVGSVIHSVIRFVSLLPIHFENTIIISQFIFISNG